MTGWICATGSTTVVVTILDTWHCNSFLEDFHWVGGGVVRAVGRTAVRLQEYLLV